MRKKEKPPCLATAPMLFPSFGGAIRYSTPPCVKRTQTKAGVLSQLGRGAWRVFSPHRLAHTAYFAGFDDLERARHLLHKQLEGARFFRPGVCPKTALVCRRELGGVLGDCAVGRQGVRAFRMVALRGRDCVAPAGGGVCRARR